LKRYYIYLLLHPVLLYPLYVGQSTAPHLRYRQHVEGGTKRAWGMQPRMVVVGLYRSKKAVDYAENLWVDMLLRLGVPLRNKALTRRDTPVRYFFWIVPLVRLMIRGR
jgi:hypothetical protein